MQRPAIRVFAENAPSAARVLEFRNASRIGSVKAKLRSDNLPSATQPNCMAQPTRAADIADPTIAMERGRPETSINLHAESENAGPIERGPALHGADVTPHIHWELMPLRRPLLAVCRFVAPRTNIGGSLYGFRFLRFKRDATH